MNKVPFRLLLLLAGLTACLRYLLAETARLRGDLGFPLDDSWIHLQFARNLAHGFGLSYNPGDLVTGSTAPLWTALLAVLFVLPGSVVVWTKALGVVLYLAGIDATWRLARELGLPRGLSALAAALTLATALARLVRPVGHGDPPLHPAFLVGNGPAHPRASRFARAPGPPAAFPGRAAPSPCWPGRKGSCFCCWP